MQKQHHVALPLLDEGRQHHLRPSFHGDVARSPEGNDGRCTEPACADLDSQSASPVSGMAGAGSVS
jgi:hypothetical protein